DDDAAQDKRLIRKIIMTMELSSLKPDQLRANNNIIARLSLRQPQQDSQRALAEANSATDHKLLNPKRDVPQLL
ncbi:hypothetical protein MWK25_26915, partial [Escherichia coli]|uniref:hypothetical protein n=1 Tax=Escherichia coli TaxID=562 RepID=UPI00201F4A3E